MNESWLENAGYQKFLFILCLFNQAQRHFLLHWEQLRFSVLLKDTTNPQLMVNLLYQVSYSHSTKSEWNKMCFEIMNQIANKNNINPILKTTRELSEPLKYMTCNETITEECPHLCRKYLL